MSGETQIDGSQRGRFVSSPLKTATNLFCSVLLSQYFTNAPKVLKWNTFLVLSLCHWSLIPSSLATKLPLLPHDQLSQCEVRKPEPKLLLPSILSPVVSFFSSSFYWEKLFFLHPVCHFCKNSTAPPLRLPHVAEIQPPAWVLLFLSLLASSLQTACSMLLSLLKVGEELLQKWHLSFGLISTLSCGVCSHNW